MCFLLCTGKKCWEKILGKNTVISNKNVLWSCFKGKRMGLIMSERHTHSLMEWRSVCLNFDYLKNKVLNAFVLMQSPILDCVGLTVGQSNACKCSKNWPLFGPKLHFIDTGVCHVLKCQYIFARLEYDKMSFKNNLIKNRLNHDK